MGALHVGDMVVGADGRPTTVLAYSEIATDHLCYRLTFADGAQIIAGADHRWPVCQPQYPKGYCLRTSHRLYKRGGIPLLWRPDGPGLPILDIEPVPSVPVRCIQVAAKGGLFLCGPTSLPTHNSDLLLALARLNHHQVLLLRRTFPDLERSLIVRSQELYGDPVYYNAGKHVWRFPDKQRIEFGHLDNVDQVKNYQSAAYDMIGFDELTQFCHAPGTEVLTDAGWQAIEKVQTGARVLALDHDWQAKYEDVVATYSFAYNGPLLTTKNTRVRYAITPNHSMVVQSQRSNQWHFCEARFFADNVIYPFDHYWLGVEQQTFTLEPVSGRGLGSNANVAAELPMDDWLEFLGWFIAEGSSFLFAKSQGGTSPCVSIRQTRPQPTLKALMARLPWRCRPDGDGGYRIFSRQLFDLLHPLGDTYTKRVPRYVMGLSARQIKIFLDAFLAGDGSETESGGQRIGLANAGLRDDIQEICALLGFRSTASYYKARQAYDVYGLSISKNAGGFTMDLPENRKYVPYQGQVYCLAVEPDHTFLARYDGRVFWSGNSRESYIYMLSRLRTTRLGQRVRIVSCTNPGNEGNDWVLERWAPWLDPDYPNPAKAAEIRWFKALDDKHEVETTIDDPDAISRSFIPAFLTDNPFLPEEYRRQLRMLPEPWRSQLLYGAWHVGMTDDPHQIIPTRWIRAAQERWAPGRPGFIHCLGVDLAHGGEAQTVIAPRSGSWIGELIKVPGVRTQTGSDVTSILAPLLSRGGFANLDIVGVGASAYDDGIRNKLNVIGVNVSAPSGATDRSGKLRFLNLRAEMYWKLREALDPESDNPLALPPDPELSGDLRAQRWEITKAGIKVQNKDEISKRLGRSPDCGDAVALTMLEAVKVVGGVGAVF